MRFKDGIIVKVSGVSLKIYFYLISFYVLFNNSNAIIEHISQNSKFFLVTIGRHLNIGL
ncbi:hypothetical protein Cabys_2367 [Caldithrix abyssi DSM 13497]|uniref:Uncharacterized protein n=1 Tax=Caldithrix abyssi DSM 13497 TaxID=880073 RepID=A0A1J1C9M6_CALAY|nr:hypothetical protein Cabys_2367 [Caldithrix abyssi DSM 13497]